MPVVHSSASVFSTEGVFTGHGPSSKVRTTSLSRRKSSSLKCSKPKPGPPVVSISTVRPMPSALGLLQGGRVETGAAAGAGAGAACGNVGAPLAGGVCAHAALDANSETAPAKINPAAIRILFSSNSNLAPGLGAAVVRSAPNSPTQCNLVGAAAPTQRLRLRSTDLSLGRLIQDAANARAMAVFTRVSTGSMDSGKRSAI